MSIARVVAFAAPVLWAILVLFHPNPGGDSAFEGIEDSVDRWLIVHVGQLILTPFLFWSVWWLLNGLSSTAARISRCALVVWTVFFSAYDSIQGVATGVLIRHASGFAGEEQAGVVRALDFLVDDSALAGNISIIWGVASVAWVVVAIAAAVALHKAAAGIAVVAATCVAAVFVAHAAPAAIGLVALFIALLLRDRQRTKSVVAAPAGT